MLNITTLRSLTFPQKKFIAGKQFYKCANKPGANLHRLGQYKCVLWQRPGINKGSFDESGYEIDHIVEFSIGGLESESNLQALCLSCHAVKTKKFLMAKTQFFNE